MIHDDSIEVGALHPIKWRSRYGEMSSSELKRLKVVEVEFSQYKKMYSELARENYALKELIEKTLRPPEQREAPRELVITDK